MNKVLVVAFHFPPDGLVGANRTARIAKWLPLHGWMPYVLTVKEKYYEVLDYKKLRDVEGIPVFRTAFLRTPREYLVGLRDALRGKRAGQEDSSRVAAQSSSPAPALGLKGRLKHLFIDLNWFPDDKLYWNPFLLMRGAFVVLRHRIKVIYVSAPPHSALFSACALAMLPGRKLVIDFRDPWTLLHGAGYGHEKGPFVRAMERWLERFICRRASAIFCTNGYFKEKLAEHLALPDKDKVHVLHNGYDAGQYAEATREEGAGASTFVLSYIGTFYLKRSPRSLLAAFRRFLEKHPLRRNAVELRFIGNVMNANGESLPDMVREHGLEDVVLVKGVVPHEEALRYMAQSDGLVIMAVDEPLIIPAKTYEYMAARKPILALVSEGAASRFIAEHGIGFSARPDDMDDILAKLEELYQAWLEKRDMYADVDVSQFDRANQAKLVAGVLNSVLGDARVQSRSSAPVGLSA